MGGRRWRAPPGRPRHRGDRGPRSRCCCARSPADMQIGDRRGGAVARTSPARLAVIRPPGLQGRHHLVSIQLHRAEQQPPDHLQPLRLQGRRLSSPEAKAAIEESVWRIRSIALVHQILSHQAGGAHAGWFVDIALASGSGMVEEGLLSPYHPIDIKITWLTPATSAYSGHAGPAALNELLHNVVDHAYPAGDDGPAPATWPDVLLELDNDGRELSGDRERRRHRLLPGFTAYAVTGLGVVDRAHLGHHRTGRDHRLGPGLQAAPAGHRGRPRVPSHRGRDARSVTPRRRGHRTGARRDSAPRSAGDRSVGLVAFGSGSGAAAGGGPLPMKLAALLLGGAAPVPRSPCGLVVSVKSEGTRAWPRTWSQRPWPRRSGRWPGRWCPPGKNRSGSVSRQAADVVALVGITGQGK